MTTEPSHKSLRRAKREAGSRLGRYMVGTRLASGGAASVYLARLKGPMSYERFVALKVIHEHLMEEKEFVDMFLDEANLASRLQHPNIVSVFELARDDDLLFQAMEYLHGEAILRLCQVAKQTGELLPHDLVAWIGARAAAGLQHAHELRDDAGKLLNLVHRDVSPQNIFVTYDGQVKVVDFGIARAEGRLAETQVGTLKGKFSYMSPEQAMGKDVDPSTDVFALGITLVELATARRLYRGRDEVESLTKVINVELPPLSQLRRDFPPQFEAVLRGMLARDPAERTATAGEAARQLDAFVAAEGAGDPRARLAQLMQRMFAPDRIEKERAMAELKSQPDEAVEETNLVASAKPRGRASAWLFGLVLLAASVVAAVYTLRRPAPVVNAAAPTPAAPVPSQVTIEVTVRPDVPARITVGGSEVAGRPARAQVPLATEPVEVRVTADGYEPAEHSLIPDRDRALLIPLSERRVAAKPPDAATTPDAAPPAPKPRGGPVRPKGPSIITDNPF